MRTLSGVRYQMGYLYPMARLNFKTFKYLSFSHDIPEKLGQYIKNGNSRLSQHPLVTCIDHRLSPLGSRLCRIAGVGCDDAAELVPAAYRAITGGTKINLKDIVANVSSTVRAFGVVMAHPSAQDVIELRAAEADEKIQTFALHGADERFGEGIGVGRPVRDLDDPGTFRSISSAAARNSAIRVAVVSVMAVAPWVPSNVPMRIVARNAVRSKKMRVVSAVVAMAMFCPPGGVRGARCTRLLLPQNRS